MALASGTRLGPFEVTGSLGAGGMGEVYRARDTKLDRDVALKVLPEAFTDDAERLARFSREAKLLASLNHPNIAAIYGLEDSGATHALVLELVEGPTLADRVGQGAIPLDEALPIARQIAEALEVAHEQGIIHRDLKPANVKVRPDGTVKVLDFGLAKALEPERTDVDVANSPTMSMSAAATQAGFILGTAAYMSPEQARGKPVDKRSDIWAFGVVLYEMLTGQRAFQAEDISLTLAEVMKSDPDLTRLPTDTSAAVETVVRRCLVKDPKERIRDIGDVRLALAGAFDTVGSATTDDKATGAEPAIWRRPGMIAAGLVLALAAGGLAVRSLTPPPTPIPLVRMPIPLPEGQVFTPGGQRAVAISPNGRHVVYSANGLRLRPVDQLEAALIPGTGDGGVSNAGRAAFFSPDGRWIGYWQQGQIKKVAITGGAPVALAAVERGIAGGSWGDDDTILFGRIDGGVWRVPGTGGTPEQIIEVEAGESARAPQVLPGGEWVLFSLRLTGRRWEDSVIVAQSLATGERKVLIEGGRDARYVSTGHLVYLLSNVLFAVPFDARTLTVTGGPVSLVEDVRASVMFGAADFDLSDTGSLVYLPAFATGSQQVNLVWVDRTGTFEALAIEPGSHGLARVSPDGTRLAMDGDGDIWIYEVSRNTLTRLTFDEALDDRPLWSPDGSRVVFSSTRHEGGLFWRAADGTGGAELLLEGADPVAGGWTPDGRLVFSQGGDIAVLAIDGEPATTSLLATEFVEDAATVSPDGRWLAYTSDESGEAEVYVRPFPDVESGKWQVSNGGGNYPVWSPDGREIFFSTTVGGSGSFMAARVETEPTFRTATPERLFGLESFADARGREWDVAPDGERFLFRMAAVSPDADLTNFNGVMFVQGWFEELKARVPTP